MDCCAFQRLSKPWPKQNEWWKTRFCTKNIPTWDFRKKNSSKNPRSMCQIKQKELDPYLYIIAVEILQKPSSKVLVLVHCKHQHITSIVPHLYTLANVFQKKTCQCIKKELLSPKQHVKLSFLSTIYSCLAIIEFSHKKQIHFDKQKRCQTIS